MLILTQVAESKGLCNQVYFRGSMLFAQRRMFQNEALTSVVCYEMNSGRWEHLLTVGDLMTCFCPNDDGTKMCIGKLNGEIDIINVGSDRRTKPLKTPGSFAITCVLMCAGEVILAGTKDGLIYKFEKNQTIVSAVLGKHAGDINKLVYDAAREMVYSASEDMTIGVWNARTLEKVATLCGHEGSVKSIALVGSTKLVSGGADRKVVLWDVDKQYKKLRTLGEHDNVVTSVCVTANNNYVLSSSFDYLVRMWSVGNTRVSYLLHEQKFVIRDVAVSRCEKFMAIATWEAIRIVNVTFVPVPCVPAPRISVNPQITVTPGDSKKRSVEVIDFIHAGNNNNASAEIKKPRRGRPPKYPSTGAAVNPPTPALPEVGGYSIAEEDEDDEEDDYKPTANIYL